MVIFMYLNYNNNKYEILIIKKNNKNTYIRVKDDLKIYVTTNKYVSNNNIEKLIKDNYNVIIKMIDKVLRKKEKIEKNIILGKEIDVVKLSSQVKPELYNNKLFINNTSKVEKYIKEFAYNFFNERLNYIYNIFEEKIPYPKLKVRKMSTRWGVCNKNDKTITLNFELIRMDVKYTDYVIIHELSHFVYFDHSKNFWNLVGKYCSNYKELRKEMKE